MTWLHFIGRQYYKPQEFISEAKRLGITRRVSLQTLKQMSFGDKVYLATYKTHTEIFGYFIIKKISGLSPEASLSIQAKFKTTCVSPGGGIVNRGCGSYVEGPTYVVDASIQEICSVLENIENPGLLMVGGEFRPHERVRLKDVPFMQGFRKFNEEKFRIALDEWKTLFPKRKPLLKGLFYVFDKETGQKVGGEVQEVQDYKRKKQLKSQKTEAEMENE